MSLRSHVDPCTFVVFMHVRQEQVTDEVADIIQALQIRHGDSLDPVLERLQFRTHQILFHETYHFWQGLRLPFLYRYAFVSFIKVWQAFMKLAKTGPDYREWSCWLPELHRLELKARIGHAPVSKIFWGGDDAKFPDNTTYECALSPLDLLECAASLAEFQVCTAPQERSNPLALQRWAKRNPAYLEPFRFASSFLESDTITMRLLLPLINASFCTTEPSRAFVDLLARVRGIFLRDRDSSRKFLAHPEPCRWPELFRAWLDGIEFEAAPDSNSSLNILETAYYRLDLPQVPCRLRVGSEFAVHPFLGILAARWTEEERKDPQYGWLMDFPGWVSEDVFAKCRQVFSPPLSVLRFHIPTGTDRTLLWGSDDLLSGFSSMFPGDSSSARGFIADFLAMYGIVRRASGTHFDEDQRTCHHRSCPHYEANFCNAYPIVPEEFAKCGFHTRAHDLIDTVRAMP